MAQIAMPAEVQETVHVGNPNTTWENAIKSFSAARFFFFFQYFFFPPWYGRGMVSSGMAKTMLTGMQVRLKTALGG